MTDTQRIWDKWFGSEAMVKKAIEILPELRTWEGEDMDLIDTPKKLFRYAFSLARSQRREMFETPPGVGIFVNH